MSNVFGYDFSYNKEVKTVWSCAKDGVDKSTIVPKDATDDSAEVVPSSDVSGGDLQVA